MSRWGSAGHSGARLARALGLVTTIAGCAPITAPPDPRCTPPDAPPAVAPDTLAGGVIAGDWTITTWEPPPGCRVVLAALPLLAGCQSAPPGAWPPVSGLLSTAAVVLGLALIGPPLWRWWKGRKGRH